MRVGGAVAGMTCSLCGKPAIATAPGTEPIHELFLLSRGEPIRSWCWEHWLWAFRPIGQERPQ